MAITRQKKEEVLKELIDKFGKSKSIVFADYRGLDVAGISKLRNDLRESDAEMKVAKKTLISLAAKESKIEIDPSSMEGPVAATFSYEDPLSGIQALFRFSKENNNLKLLGGVIDGEAVSPEVIEKYAKLPSHEQLLANFIGSLKSPTSGFVGILGGVLGGFVRAMSAYKDTLPQEEATPPKAKEEEKASEEIKIEEPKAEAESAPAPADDKPAEPETAPEAPETPATEPEATEEKPDETPATEPEATEETPEPTPEIPSEPETPAEPASEEEKTD